MKPQLETKDRRETERDCLDDALDKIFGIQQIRDMDSYVLAPDTYRYLNEEEGQ